MDKQRNALLEAMSRHGSAICADLSPLPSEERSSEALELLDSFAMDIMKFVEPTDSKVSSRLTAS